jgi:Flp pilus assembly protein TadG
MVPIRPDSRRSDRGAALVEFALVLPLLLVVIAGIVDFAFAFQRYEVITNAAREGARMAVLPVGYTEDEIRLRVREYVRVGLGLPTLAAVDPMMPVANIDVTYPDLTLGSGTGAITVETALVEVEYQHSWLILRPILGLINKNWGTNITLNATSQMTREPGSGSSGGGS